MSFLRPSEDMLVIVSTAVQGAAVRGHARTEPEHLLLALAGHPTAGGVGAAVLGELGVDLVTLKVRAEGLLATAGAGQGEGTQPAASQRMQRVMDLASEEAADLGDSYIGTEHLLLGLLREEGPAADVLVAMGCTYSAARRGIKRFLGIDEPAPSVCPGCGYDLRASKGRCPECGRLVESPEMP